MRKVLCALLLFGLAGVAMAKELPDDAPDGQQWMGCWIRLHFPDATAKEGVAGYWLVDSSSDSEPREEAVERYKAQWMDEYSEVLASEYPGFDKVESGCVAWTSRSNFPSYAAWAHAKLSQAFRSDFVPSFAKAFVPSRGDAWEE